jgi:hypothetical protein
MKYLLLLFSLLFTRLAFASVEGSIEAGLEAESNAFYFDDSDVGDFNFNLRPSLLFQNKGKFFPLKLNVDSVYKKYMVNSNLDMLNYVSSLEMPYNTQGKWQPTLKAHLVHDSEPPLTAILDRTYHNEYGGGLLLRYNKSELTKYYLDLDYIQESFDRSNLDYLKNQKMHAELGYDFFFLPETALVVRGRFEQHVYPEGMSIYDIDDTTSRYKPNNQLFQLVGGVKGRLTEFTKVDLQFGYAFRQYVKESSFSEPVFSVNFEEQVSPQDLILAGYVYKVDDTYYTNYVLDQTMYLGYARVYGDRLIFYTRLEYIYRSYSRPNRREDQRVYGNFKVEYSYRSNVTWICQLLVDAMSTDTFNLQNNAVDPAASYEALSLSTSIKYSF